MSSSQNQQMKHETSSQCPDCKKKYDISSQEEDGNQRIIIPIRKDMLHGHNSQTDRILKNLQTEIENLKHTNVQKDKMIDDLKKQIQYKMTHYMLYGELHKQADEINKLKSQMSAGSNIRYSRRNQIDEEQVRQIVKQQSRRIAFMPKQNYAQRYHSQQSNNLRQKCHSTHDNYNKLRKQFLMQFKQQSLLKPQKRINRKAKAQPDVTKEYFESQIKVKEIFNIKDAKKRIKQLQGKIKIYENEMVWMSNFVATFIKTMQNVAYKKYSQQIIIPQWSLKKKAKTSWRYMKHLFTYLYSDPQN